MIVLQAMKMISYSIHGKIKIKFTHENEIENIINYLDLTITKTLQKKVIDLGIYHKLTSNTTATTTRQDIIPTKLKHIQ